MSHYTPRQIESWRKGGMGFVSAIRCRQHLASCPECARLARQSEADDALLDEAKSSERLWADIRRKEETAIDVAALESKIGKE